MRDSNTNHPFPKAIGEYRLLGAFQEQRTYRRFQLAEYSAPDGRIAIAKQWVGSRYSLNYARFQNELRFYCVMAHMNDGDRKYFEEHFARVRVPKLIQIVGSGSNRILLIEKIEGESVSALAPTEQIELYEQVLAYLQALSERIFSKKKWRRRTLIGQCVRLPLVILRVLIRRPREWRLAARATYTCLKHIRALLSDHRMQFAHRDLWAANIIVSQGVATIIDFDLSLFMHPFIDIIEVTFSTWESEKLRALWQSSPTYSAALRTPADRAVFQALGNFTALFELGMPTTNIEKVRSFVNYSPTITESTALKKKRIIFSNYDDLHNPYYAGGGAVAVHEVAKRLTHDSEVIVLTGTYPGAQNIIVDGVQYRRIGTALFGPKMTQLLFALLLPWYVMRLSFDVWVESFTPPFSTSCLQLFTRKKVIGLVHMLAGEDMRRKYHLPFHSVERQGLKTYKRFIVLTDAVAKTIRGINPKASIAIINNGVDFPEVKSSLDEKKYITYIGRIEMDQKGLDLLLEGFARVADRIPYTLAIAGTGISKEVAKLQALITKLGLQHKVKLFGRVSGLEKSAMLNASLFTVLPSRQETFSLFALESLSYGLPLVTFDIEGLQWLPDDCCIKISSFNYELLGEKMLSLALYPERYAGIAKQGKGHIELFNWDDVAHRYRESILATV